MTNSVGNIASQGNNFDVSSFKENNIYTRRMVQTVDDALEACIRDTEAIINTMTAGDAKVNTVWKTINTTLKSIRSKYQEKTNKLIELLNEYEQETIQNNVVLYNNINKIEQSLQSILNRISSL